MTRWDACVDRTFREVFFFFFHHIFSSDSFDKMDLQLAGFRFCVFSFLKNHSDGTFPPGRGRSLENSSAVQSQVTAL